MNHPLHTFCFAELQTTAPLDLTATFYGNVLGWTIARVTDGFHVFEVEGQHVIGVRPSSGEHRLIGYVRVQSVDRMAERAQALGAAVDTPPFDTPGVARTCVLADPEGAMFGLWEPRGHEGAHVQDRVGSMWWVELLARDIVDARHFYTRLFGWDWRETPKYEISERPYTIFTVPDAPAAGALQYHPDWGVSPRWLVFFQIADWDSTIARAKAAGGELGFWRDVPHAGRSGGIFDPSGAQFVVMRTLQSVVGR